MTAISAARVEPDNWRADSTGAPHRTRGNRSGRAHRRPLLQRLPRSLGSLTDFAEFATARLPHLLGYAHALTGDRRLAEDLVQEALVRTGLAWARVRRKDRPDRYVKTAIVRLYLNQRRDDRRMVLAPDPDSSTTERGFTRVEDYDSLRRALTRVPRRMRAVLVLRYLEGLSDEEIAELLRCSRGTVRTQAARGLMKLREAYESGVGKE